MARERGRAEEGEMGGVKSGTRGEVIGATVDYGLRLTHGEDGLHSSHVLVDVHDVLAAHQGILLVVLVHILDNGEVGELARQLIHGLEGRESVSCCVVRVY